VGTLVSLFEYPQMEHGVVGVGSTHHFAFRVSSEDELEGWRRYLTSRGVPCTPVLDRGRFKSLYIRDPDGHIVEIATDLPGFDPA
jgi:catechol 2,3-dioxygenase-like lactoylglutathione lyase family enzyme